jgi:hypothetical protein
MPSATAPSDLPPLWRHQERELEEHLFDEARALLWSMRTGKTRTVIQRADLLRVFDQIDCVLVFAPNGVHDNWILRELPKYSRGHRSLAWEHQERNDPWFLEALEGLLGSGGLPWLTVNAEALQYKDTRRAVGRFIRGRRFLFVCDESDDYGAPGSKRTLFARAVGKKAAFRMILTGTVAEDSPLRVFSQFEILREGALGFTRMSDFERRYAEFETARKRNGRTFPKLMGYRNIPELRDRMAPYSSVVLREDCHDMPELLRLERAYRPSKEQLVAYEDMCLRLSAEADDGLRVTTPEAAARLVKLQQILSGYLLDPKGRAHDIAGPNPRLDVLSTECLLDPGQVIVWCRFREDVERCAARLKKDGRRVGVYYGGMTGADKNSSVDGFQARRLDAFVGTPIRGLELSEADTILWFSHVFHAMLRSQADERGTKMGGSGTSIVDFIAQGLHGGGIDLYILDNLRGKRDMSEDLARGGLKRVLEECRL